MKGANASSLKVLAAEMTQALRNVILVDGTWAPMVSALISMKKICYDLCDLAEISLMSRVAMSSKYSQYPIPFEISLAPSDIFPLSRPN